MAIKTTRTETQKITIVIPKIVLQRMDELIPARQRSRFIAQTLSERLALEEQVLALEESAGAWSDASHPELADEEAIDRWLVDLRTSWVLSTLPDHGDLSA